MDERMSRAIKIAENRLNMSVKNEDWSGANSMQGYLDGLRACSECFSQSMSFERNLGWIEWNLKHSKQNNDYGKCAYWTAFNNGFW